VQSEALASLCLLWRRSVSARRPLKGQVVRDAVEGTSGRVFLRLRLQLELSLLAQEVRQRPLLRNLPRGEPMASPLWGHPQVNRLCGYPPAVVANVL
jgi:hypothetical protein